MAHPPREQFLRLPKAAGVKPKILQYVLREFTCENCDLQRRPVPRRKAAVPPCYAFDEVVGVDCFFIRFGHKSIPFLNVICDGANLQVVVMIRDIDGEVYNGTPTSNATWKTFLTTWLSFFYEPEILISDGGPEFDGRFARGLEQHGVFHHVVDSESPWQNARARTSRRLDQGEARGRTFLRRLRRRD